MTIEDRNLKPGTKLVARYKGETYKCNVIDSPEGIRYQVLGQGKPSIYKTPSGAGRHVRGGKATNGWAFWSLEGSEEAKPKARKAKANPKPDAFEQLEDGSYWCNACAEGFEAPKGVTPKGCPKGHTAAQSNGKD